MLNVRDLRDVSEYVPSFVMPNYGSRYTSSMYVRGIGSRVNSPAVGIYVDNIPVVNKSMFNFHTYELQRLDVLRGPQGTLYGQNTEGGLVRMYSRSPLIYQGTDVKLGFGTGLYRKAEVSHYNKVNDHLGFSLAGFYQGQQGFFDNSTTATMPTRWTRPAASSACSGSPPTACSSTSWPTISIPSRTAFPTDEMT